MSYPITRITVRDTPPPNQTITIGHMYAIAPQPEPVFSTVVRLDEEDEQDETEVKVVRRGRRPVIRANEAAETK